MYYEHKQTPITHPRTVKKDIMIQKKTAYIVIQLIARDRPNFLPILGEAEARCVFSYNNPPVVLLGEAMGRAPGHERPR
jgi:hypothetical protein